MRMPPYRKVAKKGKRKHVGTVMQDEGSKKMKKVRTSSTKKMPKRR